MASSRLGALVPGWLKYSDLVVGLARQFLRLRTRRLETVIFTATTGRAGSKALAKLFATVPDCVALHEPYPIMNEEILRAASYGDTALVDRTYRRIKSINILRAAVGRRYYLESNHLFVKTFIGQAIEDFGDRLAVVHLVRSPVEVAMSLYCLDQLPGTEIGDTWWLDYRAPANLIQIAPLLDSDPELSHPFYKGLWYWYELELRFAGWRVRHPAMKVTRFDTEGFNDKQKVFQLLDELGIVYDRSKVESVVGRKEHLKLDLKVLPPLPRAEAERMHARFTELLRERGLDVGAVQYPG